MNAELYDILCEIGLYFIGIMTGGCVIFLAAPYVVRFVVRAARRAHRRRVIARKRRAARRRDKSVMKWIFRREAICFGGYRLTTR